MTKHYFYLYRTRNYTKIILGIIEIEFIENLYWKSITCTKRILEIIEREFIENLYNTGLTDQKTILYKYWKNIL